jgi:hypothetical protein
MTDHQWGNGSLYGWADEEPQEIQPAAIRFKCPACHFEAVGPHDLVMQLAQSHIEEQHTNRPTKPSAQAQALKKFDITWDKLQKSIGIHAGQPARVQLKKNEATGVYEPE